MRDKELKELLDAVENLNYELWDKIEPDTWNFGFSYSTNGNVDNVDLFGLSVWDSENDERLYLDEINNKREDFETFLRRRTNEMLDKLSLVRF